MTSLMRVMLWGACLALSACQQQPDASTERFELSRAGVEAEQALPSPDTSRAIWTVAPTGKAIMFGNAGAKPWLTVGCILAQDTPPQLAVIRHASALPGQTALFALMGNGFVSRLPADAKLADGEWRWEAHLPAADPAWDIFIGTGDMRATLPGKGAIEIAPSPVPSEFVTWCRAGGRTAASEPGTATG